MTPPPTDHNTVERADRYGLFGLAFLAMYGALVVVPWSFLVLRMSDVAGWMVIVALALTAGVVALLAASVDRVRAVAAGMILVIGSLLVAGVVAHQRVE